MAGISAGWLVAPPAAQSRARWRQAGCLAALGAAADLDLLIHRHSAETHSIGAAMIAATVAAVMRWPIARTRARIWWAACLAWSTHPLLDSLSPDTSPPIGIMAFWPFSHRYFISGLSVFMPVWRTLSGWREIRHDLLAVVREVAILLPILALVWWIRRPRTADVKAP